MTPTFTAFDGSTLLAHGPDLSTVVAQTAAALGTGPRRTAFLFDDRSGKVTDLDTTSTAQEALENLDPDHKRAGPGRPKLGVVSREVSLLPRHWGWLATQPGGASATLRRLVDAAQNGAPEAPGERAARDAAWRFLSMMAPDVPGAEALSRALFAGRYPEVRAAVGPGWQPDVATHFLRLLAVAEAGGHA